ncbi:MAG TPA: ligase, partial [Bradyrhizobium sp.]
MPDVTILKRFDRTRLARLADWLAVAVAASLPVSTSATGILVVLWLLVLIPNIDLRELRQIVATPVGGLPALLFLLGAVGMLWADVTWIARWDGLESFFKLLMIPLLFVQFRNSERGLWAFGAYLAACMAILLVSTIICLWPSLWWGRIDFAVPVKNAATQSGEFVTCIFGLLYLAVDYFERRRWLWFLGLLAVAFGM